MRLIFSNSITSYKKSDINLIPDLSYYTHSNRSIIDSFNIIISLSENIDQSILDKRQYRVLDLKKKILNWSTFELNKRFHKSYSVRCWEVFLGHWIERYIIVVLNKFEKFEKLLKENLITEIFFSNSDFFILDEIVESNDFVTLSNNEHFKSLIYYLLYDEFFRDKKIKLIIDKNPFLDSSEPHKKSIGLTNRLKYLFNKIFSSKNKFLFYNTFLAKKSHFLLNFKFLQFPFLTYNLNLKKILKYNHRKFNITQIDGSINIEKFLIKYFFCFIPKTFNECFPELEEISSKYFFDNNPYLIFTSNSFDTDDLFKSFLVSKINQNVKYFVGQHGAQYGVNRYYLKTNEIISCDTFYTWGWGLDSKKFYKGVYLKEEIKKNNSKKNKILIFQKCIDHSITLYDNYYTYERYIQDQFKFISNVNSEITSSFVIRLMSGSKNLDGFEFERWSKSNLQIDIGNVPVKKSINKYKLLIFTYDSTVLYEAIDLGIPLIFISFEKYFISDDVINIFNKLKSKNIYFDDYRQAAHFINQNYLNLISWWNCKDVQETILEFKNTFSNKTLSPESSLFNFVTNV